MKRAFSLLLMFALSASVYGQIKDIFTNRSYLRECMELYTKGDYKNMCMSLEKVNPHFLSKDSSKWTTSSYFFMSSACDFFRLQKIKHTYHNDSGDVVAQGRQLYAKYLKSQTQFGKMSPRQRVRSKRKIGDFFDRIEIEPSYYELRTDSLIEIWTFHPPPPVPPPPLPPPLKKNDTAGLEQKAADLAADYDLGDAESAQFYVHMYRDGDDWVFEGTRFFESTLQGHEPGEYHSRPVDAQIKLVGSLANSFHYGKGVAVRIFGTADEIPVDTGKIFYDGHFGNSMSYTYFNLNSLDSVERNLDLGDEMNNEDLAFARSYNGMYLLKKFFPGASYKLKAKDYPSNKNYKRNPKFCGTDYRKVVIRIALVNFFAGDPQLMKGIDLEWDLKTGKIHKIKITRLHKD